MAENQTHPWKGGLNRTAVLIPFLGRFDQLAECVSALPDDVHVILVDDGSSPIASTASELIDILARPSVTLLTQDRNRGPGAARNNGIVWCLNHNIDTVILLDSDCVPPENFVSTHVNLHQKHLDSVVIGGGVAPSGQSYWAHVDGIMSWGISQPKAQARTVLPMSHLSTNNMSVKLLPGIVSNRPFVEYLKTGEDWVFTRDIHCNGGKIIFEPQPVIVHRDREDFCDMLIHQYRWGVQNCVLKFGRNPNGFNRLWYGAAYLFGGPVYAVIATYLQLHSWLPQNPKDWIYAPGILLVYVFKWFSVVEGAIWPTHALYADAPDDPYGYQEKSLIDP